MWRDIEKEDNMIWECRISEDLILQNGLYLCKSKFSNFRATTKIFFQVQGIELHHQLLHCPETTGCDYNPLNPSSCDPTIICEFFRGLCR